uniref:CAZy families GT2 protein n=1 Tax=uncultured Sphingomonas sp. TaxID=158754 RepID=A0A060CK47_9SPHN|nr:CAZy families GT2 protein [uncultured Sphingomonas sp.]
MPPRHRPGGYGLQADARLRVGHPSRSDWPALRKKWLRMTREGYGVNGTSGKARLRWGLRALAMPFSALAHAPKILRSDRLADNGERLRGTMTLFRLRLARMVWMLRQAAGQTI